MCAIEGLKELLDEKVAQYENPDFIDADPISVPHLFSSREDIEIAALLAATIAWGNRKAIVSSAHKMIQRLGNAPYDFIMTASEDDISDLNTFVYRTFQKDDLPSVVRALRSIYQNAEAQHIDRPLESLFSPRENETIKDGIIRFRAAMLPNMASRSHKHLADVAHGAAGKRLNMFLRWMVRSSARG